MLWVLIAALVAYIGLTFYEFGKAVRAHLNDEEEP